MKTDADTDTPCTKPLILHTMLEKGQPVEKNDKWLTEQCSSRKLDLSGNAVSSIVFLGELLDSSSKLTPASLGVVIKIQYEEVSATDICEPGF